MSLYIVSIRSVGENSIPHTSANQLPVQGDRSSNHEPSLGNVSAASLRSHSRNDLGLTPLIPVKISDHFACFCSSRRRSENSTSLRNVAST